MSDWGGFTDADLQRLKTQSEPTSKPKIVKPIKKGNVTQDKRRARRPQNTNKTETQVDIPTEAMLSQKPVVTKAPGTPPDATVLHGKTKSIDLSEDLIEKETKPSEVQIIDDEEVIQQKEKIKLEDVTKRQKEMEEKNKRKRDILSKAISERKKRANAESNKLKRIQSEFSKLDENLSFDVSILRDKIDEACYSYNNAKKHFEQTEAAYVMAKIELNKCTEHKEELTEHLYHVIQLNEERKAKKLEELMEKLDLEEDEEATKEEQNTHNAKSNTSREQVLKEDVKQIPENDDSKQLKPNDDTKSVVEAQEKTEKAGES